jgi:hypothetical protein
VISTRKAGIGDVATMPVLPRSGPDALWKSKEKGARIAPDAFCSALIR